MPNGLGATTGLEVVNSGGWGNGLGGLGDATLEFPYYVPPSGMPSNNPGWDAVLKQAFTSGVSLATNVFSDKPTFTQTTPQGSTQVWGSTYPGGFSTLPGGGFSMPSLGTLLVISAVAFGAMMLFGSRKS